MKDKEDVIKEQYEAWASTYDRDKVEIIRKDTDVSLLFDIRVLKEL